MKLSNLFFLILAFAPLLLAAQQPNILFIAIDDLRPELGCYGPELAVTPNIDKLTSRLAFSSGFPLCLAYLL